MTALVGELLVEPFAGVMGEFLGFDASLSQIAFVGATAGIVLPLQRLWRPYVDGIFFSSGRSHTEKVEELLEELPSAATSGGDALVSLVGERLEAVFESTFCAIYQLRGQEFRPAFAIGEATVRPLSAHASQVMSRILGKRIAPIRLDSRGRKQANLSDAEAINGALEGLGASVLTPLRPQGSVDAFICMGAKRNGDVYTPTDLTLLASVAHHTAEELSGVHHD